MWAAGVDYVSFFRHVAKLPLDYSKWQHYEAAAIHGGFRWMHPKFCIVSDFPERLMVDAGRRPHCGDGPSHRWRDGFEIYHWHGTRIPIGKEWIITDQARITADAIMAESNAELRRVMCEIVEWRPLLDRAKVIDRDDLHGQPRELMELDIAGERMRIVRVVNGSPEPDGSHRTFVLGAARHNGEAPMTVRAAIAASYGINPAHYREAMRT